MVGEGYVDAPVSRTKANTLFGISPTPLLEARVSPRSHLVLDRTVIFPSLTGCNDLLVGFCQTLHLDDGLLPHYMVLDIRRLSCAPQVPGCCFHINLNPISFEIPFTIRSRHEAAQMGRFSMATYMKRWVEQ